MLKDRKDRALYRTTLYVEYELMEKLKDLAHAQRKTLTELINEALREYLQKQQGTQETKEPQEPAQEQEPAPKRRKK
jgi:predicted transcriptional regulator